LKVDCLSKKPTNPGYMGCYPTLDINVNLKNNQSIPASYNLDVFFLDHGKTRETVKGKMAAGKGYKFVSTTQCRDKKSLQISLESMASTNLSFHAAVMDGKDELSVGWIGYIVRISAYGKPIKTVASNPALEKLANDPARMEQLAAGKSIPAK